MKYFQGANWYKGNLHCHTTESDGRVGREECIEHYRAGGYDFMCITDHRVWFPGGDFDGMLVLPGCELHVNYIEKRKCFHVVALGVRSALSTSDQNAPQELIDLVAGAGGISIVAHPSWSMMLHDDWIKLRGAHGIEIYNTLSDRVCARGYSDMYIDTVASKGPSPLVFAVDDAHFYDGDTCGGFVRVSCDELGYDPIMDAIRRGSFYSSQGPEILALEYDAGKVRVACSPCSSVAFISDMFFNNERIRRGDGITEAEFTPKKGDRKLRVEIAAPDGRRAWSNFIEL